MRRFIQGTLVSLTLLIADCGFGVRGQSLPKFKPVPMYPALAAMAATNQVSISQFGPPSETNALHPGDSVTMLGILVQKKSQAQWILQVSAAAPDPKGKPEKKPEPFVMNAGGKRITFQSKPVPATLQMLGPFSPAGTPHPLKPQRKNARFSLDENLLGLGLEQTADVEWRWSQATNTASSTNQTGAAGPKATDPADERAFAAGVPALISYLGIVQNTQGLNDILLKLVDMPSLWSILRHRGVGADINFGTGATPANPTDWDLPASAPVYYFPCMLKLNDEPAMKITFVVTTPHPPLLICGGVVGLLAEKVGDDETYMILRVISAKSP
jgi:hypothetical protein